MATQRTSPLRAADNLRQRDAAPWR
jgi:hypothetical protein